MTAFTDLTQALAWVFDLQKFGIKFGLSSTLDLLARLDLPYQQGRYLHIAGTNGKGSVAAMLSAVLTRAGYPVGLFTSPHLVSLQERFRLRDQEISAAGLLNLINRVRTAVSEAEPPTFFEFVTAMAFLYFLEEKADPIILETGMGGRLDATNIVQPLVAVITNISRDHEDHLGRGLVGHRRREGGHHQGRRASGHLRHPEIGPGPLPPALRGIGHAFISRGRRLQDPGPGRDEVRLSRVGQGIA